ncbi:MAG: NADH-quinone oxidoreductase subunit N [Candidatus Omnitrophota bacterium]
MNLGLTLPMPEWILFGLIALLVFNEILFPWEDRYQKNMLPVLVVLGMITSVVWLPRDVSSQDAFSGMYRHDAFASFFKVFFVFAASLVTMLSIDYLTSKGRKPIEFLLLLLCSVLGFFVLVSSAHFLLLFIALEIVTMSFYIMAAYVKKEAGAIEAALKYLILGSIASACLIYGISLVYQCAGSLHFAEVRQAYLSNPYHPVMKLGILFIISGIGFKIAAVPFQFWVPDVYEGAPTPVTSFLAVASKAAGFAVLARLLTSVFVLQETTRVLLFGTFAAMTLIYGNLGALKQKNIKRLMGYSSIGHAGYLLIALAAGAASGLANLLYYLLAYGITTLTVFYLISLVESKTGSSDLEVYRGLGKRSPFISAALFLALLSSAGVPPLAGFAGKFLVLVSAVKSGLVELALLGAIFVPVSLYYYLNVIRLVYFEDVSEKTGSAPLWDHRLTKLFVIALCGGILLLGIHIGLFYPDAERAAQALFTF